MMNRRVVKITAVLLAVIASLVFILGYDIVPNTDFQPKESTLDFLL